MYSLLVIALASLAQPIGAGAVRVTAPGEIFTEGCAAKVSGDEVRGTPGCTVRIAVVAADGGVLREALRLPPAGGLLEAAGPGALRFAGPGEVFAEGCEALLEGRSIHGTPGCVLRVAVVSPEGVVTHLERALPSAEAPAAPPEPPEARPAPLGVGVDVAVGRGFGDFGFAGLSLALDYAPTWWGLRLGLRHASGRADAPAVEGLQTTVEETLQTLTVGGLLQWRAEALEVVGGVELGRGVLEAEDVRTDRVVVEGAVQPFWLLRPSLELRTRGPVQLGLRYALTYALGEFFSGDDYASEEGVPEQQAVLTHGLELAARLRF